VYLLRVQRVLHFELLSMFSFSPPPNAPLHCVVICICDDDNFCRQSGEEAEELSHGPVLAAPSSGAVTSSGRSSDLGSIYPNAVAASGGSTDHAPSEHDDEDQKMMAVMTQSAAR
jgi:hypothetical protein